MLITADHGNAEQMYDEKDPSKAHPAHAESGAGAAVQRPGRVHSLADGKLADVAPTLLALMQVAQPAEMTGPSLLSQGRPAGRPGGAATSCRGAPPDL